MSPEVRLLVVEVAKAIHQACVTVTGRSAGNCKDAVLALATLLEPLNIPVAICQGQVTTANSVYDHYWCRIEGEIVDPTADQFREELGPLVAKEEMLKHYKEASFFVFTPRAVRRIVTAARPNISFLHIAFDDC